MWVAQIDPIVPQEMQNKNMIMQIFDGREAFLLLVDFLIPMLSLVELLIMMDSLLFASLNSFEIYHGRRVRKVIVIS